MNDLDDVADGNKIADDDFPDVGDVGQETIMIVDGEHGILDDKTGFHPSPPRTFEEEVRDDALSAMSNRLGLAKKAEDAGDMQDGVRLREEADKIFRIIHGEKSRKK